MGGARQARVGILVALLVAASLSTSACGQGVGPKVQSPQAAFDVAVSKADAAWHSGDAEAAFNLYTDALKIQGARDAGGLVAAQQDKAKRLVVSRRILAKAEPALGTLSSYVQVLQYSAAESTEAAAARNGLADCLKPYPKGMRAEVVALRRDIKANKSIAMPLTSALVVALADGWLTEVAQAPGSSGTHAAAAAKHLGDAAAAVSKAFDSKYADDALADLARADKALVAAAKELEAARTAE